MPTVILLDVSLSMCRLAGVDTAEETQRLNFAIHGINTLLDYCASRNKLEFISLIVFSSLWEHVEAFTRDYDKIKSSLTNLRFYDKTYIESGLQAATSIIVDEWGYVTPCQVLLITDGSLGSGEGSLGSSLENHKQGEKSLPLPFPFPSKLHVICIGSKNEPGMDKSISMYEELVALNRGSGKVWCPSDAVTMSSIEGIFKNLSEEHYAPHTAKLLCGNLNSMVNIIPAPQRYKVSHDFENIDLTVSDEIHIVGFFDVLDISSPPALSRHVMLPISAHGRDSKHADDDEAYGHTAEFTVLLHGSLKVENMVALVKLNTDWYGMIYSWADTKKKSNLMLSLFTPGRNVHSWLGDLENLAPLTDFVENPYGAKDQIMSPFPVQPSQKRSYSQNCVVWIKPAGLQSEIQKILRHARKLPVKMVAFYEELNRLRRAILSFGFKELFPVLGELLERECTQLPPTAHPEAAHQLTHAANIIRQPSSWDYNKKIQPLNSNYKLN